jgi:hypothetical protein
LWQTKNEIHGETAHFSRLHEKFHLNKSITQWHIVNNDQSSIRTNIENCLLPNYTTNQIPDFFKRNEDLNYKLNTGYKCKITFFCN